MSSHALLSPSGAHRWINCPPSVELSKGFKDRSSVYAKEGTLAHRLAELKLKRDVMGERIDKHKFKKVEQDELYSPDMQDYTDEYIEEIRNLLSTLKCKTPYIQAETKLDLSFIAPDTFGTADCIIACRDTLVVVDFKYGKNVEVSAVDNYQMMLYALGALKLLDGLTYDFSKVVMVIIQPRMNNISSFEVTKDALIEFEESIVLPKAKMAIAGEGETTPGDWCQFCRAKPICRNYSGKYNIGFKKDDPRLLTNEEVADRIKSLSGLDGYLSELKDYAVVKSLEGEAFPGLKVVEGRSSRKWSDEEAALKTLENEGIELYERKPKSIAKLERLLGKKRFLELTDGLIEKPKGKPTLVDESDKREPYSRDDEAYEDFKDFLN